VRFTHYYQLDAMDCGPTCLRMVARHYGKSYSLDTLRQRCEYTRIGVSMLGISNAAESIGMRTLGAKLSFEELVQAPHPCIVHWNQRHFVVVYKIKGGRGERGKGGKEEGGKGYQVYVADPASKKIVYSEAEFKKCWISTKNEGEEKGIALLLEPAPEFYAAQGEKINRNGFGFLIHYVKPHKNLIIQLAVGLALGSLLQLVLPFLTQNIVDVGIGTRNLQFIWLVLIAQLVLTISTSSVNFIRGWILLHLGTRINISLISDFLTKLMKLPVGFFDTKMTGDLMQRIGDHRRIQSFLTGSALNILFSMFNIVIFGVVLLYYNLTIFGVFFLLSALHILWIVLFLKKRRELDFKAFAQNAANQSNVIQLITGMQEIKLNTCEKQKRWEWERIQARLFKISIKGLALGQYQEAGATLISQLKNILITVISANAVINGHLTLGMMMSVQYIIGQLNAPIGQIIGFVQQTQDAKISLERLAEIHTKEDEENPEMGLATEVPETKSLRLDQLSFRYTGSGEECVIKDINLTIPAGKVTAIVGASGSGKTTLVKLLLGFYPPTKGRILLGVNSLHGYSMDAWRRACGAVMQDGFIFSDTIANNIAPGVEVIDKQQLANAVDTANIREFIDSLPLGFNTKIGQEGTGLSQGQKQRLLIARAVYKNPLYLFFDEATNALDANNEKVIMENLEAFFKGKTVVVVAHRLSTVKNADKIVVLGKGEILEEGTHIELAAKRGAYYELVRNQLELGG
jgi:ATP-binding cassette subfamily B protein